MTPRYLEIKYEDMLADGVMHLDRIFRRLELESEPSFCKRALEVCTLDRLKAKTAEAPWPLETQPDGFYRKGHADS
jgi:hypothetical protein